MIEILVYGIVVVYIFTLEFRLWNLNKLEEIQTDFNDKVIEFIKEVVKNER